MRNSATLKRASEADMRWNMCSGLISLPQWKNGHEGVMILITHGQPLWNEKNLFTCYVNVLLTKKGVEDAIEAGKRISNTHVGMIYTSALIRAQMVSMLATTQQMVLTMTSKVLWQNVSTVGTSNTVMNAITEDFARAEVRTAARIYTFREMYSGLPTLWRMFWDEERLTTSSRSPGPQYHKFCSGEHVVLRPPPEYP
nr:phosphoglycerate mutase 1 [Tanacetum cinerariifolium]